MIPGTKVRPENILLCLFTDHEIKHLDPVTGNIDDPATAHKKRL